MFDGRWRNGVDRTTGPVGQALHRHGITADVLTATGLISATATAVLVATGHLHWAIVTLILTGLHDLLDGPVAKAAGTASVRGAFFDSVTDRVADAVVMFGASWYLLSRGDGHLALLPMAILGVTALVSYERAKAESLGLPAKGGLMERGERMFLFGIGLLERHHLRARPLGPPRPHLLHRHRPLRQGLERRLRPRRRHRPPHRGLARGPGRLALAHLARVPGVHPRRPRLRPLHARPPDPPHPPHDVRRPRRSLARPPPRGALEPLEPHDARAPARRGQAPHDVRRHTSAVQHPPPLTAFARLTLLTHTPSTAAAARSEALRAH